MSRRSAARPGASVPRSVMPARGRRDRREAGDRLFDRQHVGHPLGEQPRGVVGAAEREQVRAAVAAAGHHDRRPDQRLGRGRGASGRAARRARTASRGPRRARGRGTRRADRRPSSSAISRDGAVEVALVLGPLDRLDAQHLPDEHERAAASGRRSPCASASRSAGSRRRSRSLAARAASACRGTIGISSNRNVEPSEKCAPCRLRREHRVDLEPVGVRGLARTRGCASSRRARAACSVSVLRCTGRPDARAIARIELAVVVVVAGEERARDELDRAAAELARARDASATSSSGCGVVRRHAAAVVRDVQLELRRREADRAVAHRGADERPASRRSRRRSRCAPTRRRPSRSGAPRSARRSRRRSRRCGRRGRRGSRRACRRGT